MIRKRALIHLGSLAKSRDSIDDTHGGISALTSYERVVVVRHTKQYCPILENGAPILALNCLCQILFLGVPLLVESLEALSKNLMMQEFVSIPLMDNRRRLTIPIQYGPGCGVEDSPFG